MASPCLDRVARDLYLALRVVLSNLVLIGRAHLRTVQSNGGESVVGFDVRIEAEVYGMVCLNRRQNSGSSFLWNENADVTTARRLSYFDASVHDSLLE